MSLMEKYPGEWQAIVEQLHSEGAKRAVENGESPLAGFRFDTGPITTELATMDAVRSHHIVPLSVGMSEGIDADLALARRDERSWIPELHGGAAESAGCIR